MSTVIGLRAINRTAKVRVGGQVLTNTATTYIDVDDVKVREDLSNHSAIGQYVVVDASSQSVPGVDTAIASYGPDLKLRPLRRDWVDVEDYSGTSTQKIVAAAADAVALKKRLVLKRGAIYDFASTIDLSSALAQGDLTIEAEDATLNYTGAGAYRMQVLGSESTKISLTSSAAANSFSITLPSGAGATWSKGDVIALESAADVYGPDPGITVRYGRARELHEILSVSGDILTLDGPLIWNYNTTDGARYSKITTGGRLKILGGLRFTCDLSTANGYAFMGKWLKDLLFEGFKTEDHPGGLQLRETIGARLISPTALRNVGTVPPWYYNVSLVGACMGTRIINYTARGGVSESSFTTLYDERAPIGSSGIDGPDPDTLSAANGDTFWGGPIDTVLISPDVTMGAGGTCIGSHGAGYGLTVVGGIVSGGSTGVIVRARNTKLVGLTILRSSARGINIVNSADDAQIIGCEVGFTGTEGIAGSAVRTRISDTFIHDTGLTGSGVGLATAGDDFHASDVTIRDGKAFGIQCGGASRNYFTDCRVPWSAIQTSAINQLGATDVVESGDMLGYGAGTNPFPNAVVGARYNNVLLDAGLVTNSTIYLSQNNAFSLGVPVSSSGFQTARFSAQLQTTKGFTNSLSIDTTSKTSAQIDTAWNTATGQGAGDGASFIDTVNLLMLVRLGGKWHSFASTLIS